MYTKYSYFLNYLTKFCIWYLLNDKSGITCPLK